MKFLTIVDSAWTNIYDGDDQLIIKYKIKLIDFGTNHIVIVTDCNKIFVTGQNDFGQLGLGDNGTRITFTEILTENDFGNIKLLQCGDNFTIIVNDVNDVFISGCFLNKKFNEFKKIKFKRYFNIKKIKNFSLHFLIITKQLDIYDYQEGKGLIFVKKKFEIKDLQCGIDHCILLTKNGEIYGLGKNKQHQLGILNKDRIFKEFIKLEIPFKIKQISCNSYGTLILNEFNDVYVCGENLNDQLAGGIDLKVKQFKKILFDKKIEYIYKSFGNFNVVRLFGENEAWQVFGGNMLSGVNEKLRNVLTNGINKYHYPILVDSFFMIESDYEINVEEENDDLSIKLFTKVIANQLTDIEILIL